MPGLRPTPPEPPDDDAPIPVNFGYLTMRAQTGEVFFAMTFQQMIAFLTEIIDRLDEDDASAIYHLNKINAILRSYLNNGN